MLIFYSICLYVCYTLYKKLSMIDLYDNNNYNDALFAFNQIPT
jgi:hypothetical protein